MDFFAFGCSGLLNFVPRSSDEIDRGEAIDWWPTTLNSIFGSRKHWTTFRASKAATVFCLRSTISIVRLFFKSEIFATTT